MIFDLQGNSNLTQVASGEHITITNSAEAPVRRLKVDGKTEQVTTTGKNLLNVAQTRIYTHNGITFVIGNGVITANGTAIDDANAYYVMATDISLSAGTYILSGCPSGGGSTTYKIALNGGSYPEDYGNGATFKLSQDFIFPNAVVNIVKGTTVNNLVFRPMIRKAEITDDTWEPYTGGIPTPSPSYPQDIEGIDRFEVTVTGKNIFGGNALANKLVECAKATKNESDGTVKFWCADVTDDVMFNTFKENTQYTFILYGMCLNTAANFTNFSIEYTDGTYKRLVFETVGVDSYMSIISDKGKTIKKLHTHHGSQGTILYYDKCGIFEGVVTLEEFEPYKSQYIDLIQDPPLFEGDSVTLKNGKLEIVRNNAIMIFDGSEDEQWTTYNNSSTYILISDKFKLGYQTSKCSHFKNINAIFGTTEIGYSDHPTLQNKYFNTDKATISEWKTYLSQNPIKLVYQLAEPTTEIRECDVDLSTYCNVTHITNVCDANMEVEYFVNSANGEVVGKLQEQVNQFNNYIVVETFEKKVNVNAGGGDYAMDISIKEGYTPIFCKIDPYSIDIVCNHSTLSDGLIEYTLSNLNDDPIERTVVATVLYVKVN